LTFAIKPDSAARILWSVRPACGEAGCKDPQCVCSLCGDPIGTPDDDPRWIEHDEDCSECDLCRDQVPLTLFRGKGRAMQRAQFHWRCFESIVEFKDRGETA
jgi:hypothetical protein